MRVAFLLAAALAAVPLTAQAADDELRIGRMESRSRADVPEQLSDRERAGYAAIFAALRGERWDEARALLSAMPDGLLHPIATAELYLAKNSPRVEMQPLLDLLAKAPDLPQADQLGRLAKVRGATTLPELPAAKRLVWFDAAPVRQRPRAVREDAATAALAQAMRPYVKDDNGPAAEALLNSQESGLSPDSLVEWQQRVAWIYYLAGDDRNARRMAAKARSGTGEWAAQADWTEGLAAWRQQDWRGAQAAFTNFAGRAPDAEQRSAGLYWAARADLASGRPDMVQARLLNAARNGETFYGLLARQALGMDLAGLSAEKRSNDWKALSRRNNVRVAAALVEIGQPGLAEAVLRHQAKIGPAEDYAALTRLAGELDLPATQLWLSHNGPSGAQPVADARYPMPSWQPQGGWRVDRALVFAHTLQESRFNAEVTSPAGAYGLMQIMPGAATDFGRKTGIQVARDDLSRPEINMAVGQSYLEDLRDRSFTGGLLPKVIAAYNAGPTPVETWNRMTRDNGDPLLYIESIPYWETRGYVMTVLRNYWMYEAKGGEDSVSRSALAQGMWPKFPGLPGAPAVRMQAGIASELSAN